MTLFHILLLVHIASGSISLLIGIYILSQKKGDQIHRQAGQIYFFAMLIASLVALPMSVIHPNYFLFVIAVFTIYMLLSGKRNLYIKTVKEVQKIDWTITAVMLLFAMAFITLGIKYLLNNSSFGVVLIIFGSISLLFVYQDGRNYSGKSAVKNCFFITHIQRMTGSYIASATAFLVVNNTVLPGVVAWLLPTLVLTPLIIIWSRKYKKVRVN